MPSCEAGTIDVQEPVHMPKHMPEFDRIDIGTGEEICPSIAINDIDVPLESSSIGCPCGYLGNFTLTDEMTERGRSNVCGAISHLWTR
jgi:hypothetical protein